MKTLTYIIMIIFITQSCTENKSETQKLRNTRLVTDTITLDGTFLELINNNGKGELKTSSKKFKSLNTLKIKPPCYFLRYNGRLTKYKYPKFNITNTVIILGGTKTDSLNHIYGSQLQGVLFKNDSIIITEGILKNYSSVYKDIGVDEKDYWGFASGLYNH
ncbi:hypothetical protein M2347_004085 [Chryseobacterium sp. H1D6B]|uniref:hypothetical protein n=1 Tax=Chryseobacterium sp. H1D6B TaxID=2940588 RepID=UPI0015CE8400|nr:hypothetical protein [Chryseobacterium sp. H1D6B]MDH6254358.1 hypothetical protein [Chryseobacterium sp. H1D6B]